MDARARRSARMAAMFGLSSWFVAPLALSATGYRTENFTVAAATPSLAKSIGDAAETYRRELAVQWLGKELPNWSERCPIHAVVSPNKGAGGVTSFLFDRGQVYGWRMKVQGSRERILDSVLPHEVTHTIFATHFRRPLPRWADEGACTTVEHPSEIDRMERLLVRYLKTQRGIPFGKMMLMKRYPPEMLPLYAQGHATAEFLINKRGRPAFLQFLEDGLRDENWPRAVKAHYGYPNLLSLQNDWLDWIRNGRPELQDGATRELLAAGRRQAPPEGDLVFRGQSPDARRLVPVRRRTETRPARPGPLPAEGATLAARASADVKRTLAQTDRRDTTGAAESKPEPLTVATSVASASAVPRQAKLLFEWRRATARR